MKQAITFINIDKNLIVDESEEKVFDLTFDTFSSSSSDSDIYLTSSDPIPKPAKKDKTKTKKLSNGSEYVPVEDNSSENLDQYQSNVPYENTYDETKNLLKSSIYQIDMISSELKQDLDAIRASKVLKKKYDYIPEITSTLGSLMSTKITAIREINKTITDSHNLDIKRAKEFKLNAKDEISDDKFIMDTYNAFIGMGDQLHGVMPSMSDMVHASGNNMIRAGVGGNENGYNEYSNNITPSQNRMRLESNPSVQTVVVYDQATGTRYFDVMNIDTGESINNVQRPDPMFLEDVTIDVNTCIARNTNLDQTYPVILLQNGVCQKY